MDLTTYDGLRAAIAKVANRDDADFAEAVPGFIALCEAQMRRDIRARSETQTLLTTVSEDSYPLPCGFDGIVSLNGTGDRPREISYVSSDVLDKYRWPDLNSYTISGDYIYFGRAPGDIRLRYRAVFAPLGARNRCNWILSKHPDAYLYGSLKHSAPYLEDDERIGLWAGLFEQAVAEINRQAINQQFGGPLLSMSDKVV